MNQLVEYVASKRYTWKQYSLFFIAGLIGAIAAPIAWHFQGTLGLLKVGYSTFICLCIARSLGHLSGGERKPLTAMIEAVIWFMLGIAGAIVSTIQN